MKDPADRQHETMLLAQAISIFEHAIELEGTARSSYVAEACGGSAALRTTVEDMLRAHADQDGDGHHTAALRPRGDALARAAGDLEGARFGSYRILARAGMGGMGVVYRAEQDDPRRVVALKVMRMDVAGDDLGRRFRREAQLLAQLQHPGIAQVYDAGTFANDWGEVPYFAMEFVEGQPIDRFVRERASTPDQVCRLMIQVCEAVQHAHQRGVLHRDLKPSNVLVAALDGGRAQPKILDFGIASGPAGTAAGSVAETVTGQLLGTLSYMSPERTTRGATVDHRADVYSLGVMLFELLSGQQPFDLAGRSLTDAAKVLASADPTRLGRHDTRFRGDLETIADKALAREPDRRYPSAQALAEDLQRHLDSLPIRARPLSTWYFLRKSVRRHRAVVAGLAATLVTLAAGLVTALWLAGHNDALARSNARLADDEREQRDAADTARDEAIAAGNDLRRALYRSEMRFVANALRDPRGHERARTLLDRWQPSETTPDVREFEWHLARRLAFTEQVDVESPKEADLHWTAAGIEFADGADWRTLDPETGESTRRPIGERPPVSIMLQTTPDGSRLVARERDRLVVKRFDDLAVLAEQPFHLGGVPLLSADGRYVAVPRCRDGQQSTWFQLFEVESNRTLRDDLPHHFGMRAYAFAHGSATFATATSEQQLKILRAPTFECVRRTGLRDGLAYSLAWSHDDRLLAVGFRHGPIDVFEVATGELQQTLSGIDGCVTSLRWDRAGTRLLSTASDSSVRVWNLANGTDRVLGAHYGDARNAIWSPDERAVASIGHDCRVKVYPVDELPARVTLPPSGGPQPQRLDWLPDGSALLVDLDDETRHYDPANGLLLEHHPGFTVRRSASGRFRSAWRDGVLTVQDLDADVRCAERAMQRPRLSAWHPTEDRLALLDPERGIVQWCAADLSWQTLHEATRVHRLQWHPDGVSLAGTSGDYYAFQLRPDAEGWRFVSQAHKGDSRMWGLSTDGKVYAIRYATREVRLFSFDDVAAQVAVPFAPPLVHADDVDDVAWSPNGARIASIGTAGTLRLWNAATAEEVFHVAFGAPGSQLRWSPDGERLAVMVGERVLVLDGAPVKEAPDDEPR
ncbi:MAG: protein kinase [Planctomycetes bacterium]|nr:protein kinase [Planctomycetota bacterium]